METPVSSEISLSWQSGVVCHFALTWVMLHEAGLDQDPRTLWLSQSRWEEEDSQVLSHLSCPLWFPTPIPLPVSCRCSLVCHQHLLCSASKVHTPLQVAAGPDSCPCTGSWGLPGVPRWWNKIAIPSVWQNLRKPTVLLMPPSCPRGIVNAFSLWHLC